MQRNLAEKIQLLIDKMIILCRTDKININYYLILITTLYIKIQVNLQRQIDGKTILLYEIRIVVTYSVD